MMMRHSQNVRTKGKRSFREKQVSQTYQKYRMSCCVVFIKLIFIEYTVGETVFAFPSKLFYFSHPDCSTGCTPKKEEAAQVGHMDMMLFASLWPSDGQRKPEL